MRRWDGRSWTVAAPESPPDRTWAVLAHLSLFALPVVGALAIRLTAGSRDEFVKHHSTEALNAQILFGLIWNLAIGTVVVISSIHAGARGSDIPPGWVLIAIPIGLLAFLVTMGEAIRGAVQAHRGVWWRYPINLRLIRGATRR